MSCVGARFTVVCGRLPDRAHGAHDRSVQHEALRRWVRGLRQLPAAPSPSSSPSGSLHETRPHDSLQVGRQTNRGPSVLAGQG